MIKNVCKKFDSNLISLYIEDKLDEVTLKKFEEHILECNDCFESVFATKKDISLLEKEEMTSVPENLLNYVLDAGEKKSLKPLLLKLLSKAIEIFDNPLDLQTEKISLSFRSDETKVDTVKAKSTNFELFLIPVSEKLFNLSLKFSDELPIKENVEIFLITETKNRLLYSFAPDKKEILIENLEKGNYSIKYINDTLNFGFID